ncbi:lipopolysaccharide assembly protein LapB [Moritella sp. F3]|uniref:tetratricopeptide repeat protein n=1 Tax=Moritella sp. F3 TaxID=2718882 RepID=UPI0018E0F4F6|nr:tetratricopeptide repeat protein [Moritella sp. F3]GIC76085.1 hypothetical protein FMO001_08120 [Moritella sp. F1]GIC82813.1 hypothetical protein FMO003_30930 [Moritella sp. F3]
MSVINQMLKGLDKENQQQQAATERSGAVIVAAPKNDNKVAIGLVTSMVVVAVVAAYLFMQKDSHATNSTFAVSTSSVQTEQLSIDQKSVDPKTIHKKSLDQKLAAQELIPELVTKPVMAELNVDNAIVTAAQEAQNTQPVVTVPVVAVASSTTTPSTAVLFAKETATITKQKVVTAPARHIVATPVTRVSTNKAVAKTTDVVARDVKPIALESVTEVEDSVSIKAVTRTPTQQAALYAKQAESALLAGDKVRAKVLFAKVLTFDKQHDLSREKLAAIFYGEQRTQSAVKLLQDGLSISPEYTNFRLMLARIYLKNKNKQQAYYYLKPHQPAVEGNVDYYAILAGLAQSLDDLDTALIAYTKLTVHEPNRAKWWLGLGITADKAKQVGLALNAYHTAQNMGQLSASSRNYINARITQLEQQ